MSVTEEERLRQVYAAYRTEPDHRVRWTADNSGNQAIVQERTSVLKHFLKEAAPQPLNQCTILDVGCGSGQVLAGFLKEGVPPENLCGVDLLADRVEAAQEAFPHLDFRQANAEVLDFEKATFDLVLLYTVFTSILEDEMARKVASEVNRVLKPGGAVVWYDFRYDNPRNPNVRGMSRKAIRHLFPGFRMHLQTVTLLPPLARRLGRLTKALYPILSTFPVLRTHYAGLLIKPQ